MSIPQSGGGLIESYGQLAEYLRAGCKPIKDWKIGTEHEKFGFVNDNFLPLPYDGQCSIKAMLEGLRDKYNWSEILEENNIIGLTKDGANVSLEPGGQLELSGAPLDSIHETCDEVNQHLKEVKSIADDLGASFFGLGAAPEWSHEDMRMMPKGRYKLMTDYMGRVGTHGTQMMYRTCTVQVNLDFSSEQDMIKKMRVGLALQPIATALFANSPFFEGKLVNHKSWRSRVWRDLDEDRTGMLPFVFEEGFGFEAWTEYVLDVPMYFVYRDGKYIDALGQSFRDFLDGKLPALPGERPKISDWADHLTTVFPEARVKQFIEMRGADGGPWRKLCALPAFWVGLMYDQNSLDSAWDICKNWDANTREEMRVAASEEGIAANTNGISLLDLARELIDISRAGLKNRARPGNGGLVPDECHFLNAIEEVIETGKSPACELIDKYNNEWQKDLKNVYRDCAY
jgi:glutamate--cysteine ligase